MVTKTCLLSQKQDQKTQSMVIKKRAPHTKPPFTLGDLKKAIPPHCFQRSLLRSLSYFFFDLSLVLLVYYAFENIVLKNIKPSLSLTFLVPWFLYVYLQCTCLAALWILGHETGHHAFSNYGWLDDTVGFIAQSICLFPYFSFKYTHHRHHARTGSLEYDEVHAALLKSQVPKFVKYLNNPPGRLIGMIVFMTTGTPLYLLLNARGRAYDDHFASHFYPYSPMYTPRQRAQVILSDLGVLLMACFLYKLYLVKGFTWVFCVYGGPYLALGVVLISLTILNHLSPAVPYYDSSEWDWLRGSLATVDRDFGLFSKMLHHATDTHVVHHLFPSLPHYHAVEATNAIKPILGDYYQSDNTPYLKALWTYFKECIYVEQDHEDSLVKGIYWFRNEI